VSRRVDWPRLIAAGMGGLRLAPDAFWALSPLELRALLGGGAPIAAPLGREGLAALMAAHPDAAEGGR
jgi:uncharacterized phage protein (TIGR02216 family)